MSRSKSKGRSRKPPKRRKRPSDAGATTEPAKVWPEKLIGAKYVRLLEVKSSFVVRYKKEGPNSPSLSAAVR